MYTACLSAAPIIYFFACCIVKRLNLLPLCMCVCVCVWGGGCYLKTLSILNIRKRRNIGLTNDGLDWKAFGSGRGLNLVLARHMCGGAEQTRRNLQSEYHMHRPSLEPRISRTETPSVRFKVGYVITLYKS